MALIIDGYRCALGSKALWLQEICGVLRHSLTQLRDVNRECAVWRMDQRIRKAVPESRILKGVRVARLERVACGSRSAVHAADDLNVLAPKALAGFRLARGGSLNVLCKCAPLVDKVHDRPGILQKG